MLIFTVRLSNLAPILIMPLFNKYIPLGDEHKELSDRLLDLARRIVINGIIESFLMNGGLP